LRPVATEPEHPLFDTADGLDDADHRPDRLVAAAVDDEPLREGAESDREDIRPLDRLANGGNIDELTILTVHSTLRVRTRISCSRLQVPEHAGQLSNLMPATWNLKPTR
jgi:hypothetical protein